MNGTVSKGREADLAGIVVRQLPSGVSALDLDYPCHCCAFRPTNSHAGCDPKLQVASGFFPCYAGYTFEAVDAVKAR